MKKLIFILLILSMVVACVATPKWYESARQTYDTGEVIIGLGSGSSRDQALSNAKTDLLQQISVKVQSTTELAAKSIETDGKEYYTESIQKATKMTVDQTVQGMKVDNEVKEKNTWFVMVSISKMTMLNSLRGELDKLSASVKTLVNDAQNLTGQGKIVLAIKNYTDAQGIIPEFYTKKALYDSFADNPYAISEDITVNSIDSNIRKVLASVRFDVVSGNQQNAKKGSQLPEPVVFKASTRNPRTGESVGISGIPVRVSYSDGQLIEKGLTDNEGLFSVNVMATPTQGDKGKIVIKMDAFNLPPYFNATLNNVSGDAFFKTSETGEVVVQVSAKDAKGVKQDKVERRLTKVLNDNNVQVNTISPLMMSGTLSVKDTKMVEGSGSSQHLAIVEMDIQFMIIRTKEVLGTITASGKGMSSKSEAEAIQKAYENININARELKQMLAASESKIQAALLRAASAEPVVVEKVVEKPVYIEREKTVYVERENPVTAQPTRKPAGEKDVHWFGPDDYLYAQKPFTNETREMWTRPGRLVESPSASTKNQAKFFDHDKGVEIWSEFFYMTVPAAINNIKDGDIVFVFHNGKKPQDERQAKTGQWKMVRVTNTEELFKEEISLSAWPYKVKLEAVRVKAENPAPRSEISVPAQKQAAAPSGAKDKHGFKDIDYIYCTDPFTNDDNEMWGRVGEMTTMASAQTKNEAELFDHESAVKVWTQYYYASKPADISNIKRGDIVFVFHNGEKPENERQAKTEQWRLVRVTNLENYYKGKITISAWPYDVPLDAVRVKR